MKRLSSVLKSVLPKSISESLDSLSKPSEENTTLTPQNKLKCEHVNPRYQAKEDDTGLPEMYYCEDCEEELDLPEPNWQSL